MFKANLGYIVIPCLVLNALFNLLSSPPVLFCAAIRLARGLGFTMATEEAIIRIPPYHYIHVLDQNSNVSRVEVGPKTYIRQDNERLV